MKYETNPIIVATYQENKIWLRFFFVAVEKNFQFQHKFYHQDPEENDKC
jgi:hypothetical protein